MTTTSGGAAVITKKQSSGYVSVFRRSVGLCCLLGPLAALSSAANAAGTVVYKANNTTDLSASGSFLTTSGGTTASTSPSTSTGTYTGSSGSTTANPNALILKWDNTVTSANSTRTGSGTGASIAVDGIVIADPGGLVTTSLNSGTLTIGGSGIDMSAATQDFVINSGTVRVGPGVNSAINETWNIAANRTLTINSALNGSQGGTSTLTLSGAGNVNINGAISQSGVSRMTVNGANVTLNNATNTASGAITLTTGTLNIGNGGTGGFLGSLQTVANTGTLNFNHSDALTFGNTVTGTGTVAQIGGAASVLTLNGSVATGNLNTRSGTTVIDTGGAVTTSSFSGIGLIAGETGVATLQGTGTWTANGDLNVGDTGSATVAATGTLNINSSSTAVSALTIGTAGGLYVGSGFTAGTLATGTVNQSNGTVVVNNTTAGTFVVGGRVSTGGTGTYNLTGGFLTTKGQAFVGGQGTGTLNLTGTGSYFANAGLLLGSGASANGTVNLATGGTLTTTAVTKGSGTGTFNFNGGTLKPIAASTTFVTGLTGANVQAGGAIIDTNGFNTTIPQALLTDTTSTGGGLTKNGIGTLTLSSANTYTGGTTVNAGTLSLANNTAAGTGTLTVSSGTSLNIANATTFVNNPVSLSGTNANATLTTASATGGISSAFTGTADQTLTIGGTIAVNLSATTKQLQGVNGTVAVPTGATLSFRASALNNGSDNALFDVNGGLTTRNGGAIALGALSGTGTVSMGAAGSNGVGLTYTIGARGTDATFGGVIQDGDVTTGKIVSVTKTGAGIETFSGANTYTGATTVNAGTLALGASNVIADASNVSLGGGTLSTNGNSDNVGTLSVSGASTLDLGAGTSIVKFSGAGTFASGATLSVLNYSGTSAGSGTDQLIVGTTLTPAQLAQINFVGFPGASAQQLSTGEVVPVVPAPSGPTGYAISGTSLYSFNTSTPGTATLVGNTTFTFAGIDFNPDNGLLYGLVIGSNAQLYTINTTTGTATAVGTGFPLSGTVGANSYNLTNQQIGFDFNPKTIQNDGSIRIRVTAQNGSDLRLNATTGGVAAVDGALLAGGTSTSIVGSAYTNNVGQMMGATTLYDVSDATDTLYVQNPPNNGTLVAVGALGIDAKAATGFDIFTDASGTGNTGFLATDSDGTGGSELFNVNLTTGTATAAGNFGALVVSDIAIQPLGTASVPFVRSITRAAGTQNPTGASSVNFTVTFSEAVTGVDAADFIVTATGGATGATVTNVSGSGTTYTVTVSGYTGSGTIRLDVADNDSIVDATANPLGGTNTGNANFQTGEVVTLVTAATSGVVISEFRLSGLGGTSDEFIELMNVTNATIDLSGWTVTSPNGVLLLTVGAGKTIKPGGHFLVTNSDGYSLSGYATADQSYTGDLALNSTILLKDNNGATVDFVGDLSSFATPVAGDQYSFTRRLESGVPQDTGTDTNDFNLVDISAMASTVGATGVGPLTAPRLGAPGPQNFVSPIQRNSQVTFVPIDAATVGTPSDGRYASKGSPLDPFGRQTLRRMVTNNTGQTVTKMRFRIVAATSGTTTASGVADLRALTSAGVTVGGTKKVQGIMLEAPSTPTVAPTGFGPGVTGNGGGLNSSWMVDLSSTSALLLTDGTSAANGIPNGKSINVEFLFGIVSNGAYRIVVDTELIP